MAAPLTPILRASVNTERDYAKAAVKVGNAIPHEMRTATRKGGGERAEQGRPSVTNNVIAHDGGSPTP